MMHLTSIPRWAPRDAPERRTSRFIRSSRRRESFVLLPSAGPAERADSDEFNAREDNTIAR